MKTDFLTLHSFFLNLDRDLIAHPELLSDTGMLMETNMETDNGSLRFCTGYLENQNCYRKITGNRNRPGS